MSGAIEGEIAALFLVNPVILAGVLAHQFLSSLHVQPLVNEFLMAYLHFLDRGTEKFKFKKKPEQVTNN